MLSVLLPRMTIMTSMLGLWMIVLVGLTLPTDTMAQQLPQNGIQTSARNIVRVRYGYFTESRPIHVGCGRRSPNSITDANGGGSWFDLYDTTSDTYYQVICYPQTSGGFAVSRLDNHQLDIANLGSTPLAQALSRKVPIKVIYITQYMGESQGIYVRDDDDDDSDGNDITNSTSRSINTPFDLRHKTIGVPFGSTMHYQLLFLLDLFSLTPGEDVTLLNLAPSEIIAKWNDGTIDGGACWGLAREHLLMNPHGGVTGTGTGKVAKTLITSNVLSDWGRPTFTNVVVNIDFANQHEQFMNHFVTMLSRLNDSFLDKLGVQNTNNVNRWDINSNVTYVPSLVDTLMIQTENGGNPTQTSINSKRKDLDLFTSLTAEEQLSCDFLGSGGFQSGGELCIPYTSQQYLATKSTSEFLLQQKIIGELGPFEQNDDVLFDEDIEMLFDGTYLNSGQRNCGSTCYPVGPYAEANQFASKLTILDSYDGLRSLPFAGRNNEIGRDGVGDSTCSNPFDDDAVGEISGLSSQTGSIGDGANGEVGKSYSDNLHCQWIIRSAGCDQNSFVEGCFTYVSLTFETLKLWSGDYIRIYTDPNELICDPNNKSNMTLLAQLTGHYYNDNEINEISRVRSNQNEVDFYDSYSISSLPAFQARGCVYIELKTDPNQERSYGDVSNWGDGFLLNYDRNYVQPSSGALGGCSSSQDCNGFPCDVTTNPSHPKCLCGGSAYGTDCSKTDSCLGTNYIVLEIDGGSQEPIEITNSPTLINDGYRIIDAHASTPNGMYRYPNDLDCTFEIQVLPNSEFVEVTVEYDLEPTHDLLYLQTGTISSGNGVVTPYVVLTGDGTFGGSETYYVPTDDLGNMSIRLTTDARGRRQGFVARIRPVPWLSPRNTNRCPLGYHGGNCEIPYCVSRQFNALIKGGGGSDGWYKSKGHDMKDSFLIGRIVSQAYDRLSSVRPMPWASTTGGCIWDLIGGFNTAIGSSSKTLNNIVGVRLAFHTPLDLEPRPDAAGATIGDKLIIASEATEDGESFEIFAEECEDDEVCSHDWQTGICDIERGRCVVNNIVDVKFDNLRDGITARLVTDRNDQGELYTGLNMDAMLVRQCPTSQAKDHCEASKGNVCVDGYCLCDGGIPCSCPCDGDPPKLIGLSIGIIFAIVIPLVSIFAAIFLWYRRRKILKSREQKHIIQSKEAELEAFRNSVVGMRTALQIYLPKLPEPGEEKEEASPRIRRKISVGLPASPPPPAHTIQWCWKETSHMMNSHSPSTIVGDPNLCWIKYDEKANAKLEKAYQKKGGLGVVAPLSGYNVDLEKMIQTKLATGFERDVQRIVVVDKGSTAPPPAPALPPPKEIDLDIDGYEGEPIPEDLRSEPQMVFVEGDVLQISKQRQDGWAFGTKLHHADEATARQLVRVAIEGATDDDNDNIFTDTGWFPLEATRVPTSEDLAALQTSVGDTSLDPPSFWDEVTDPTVVEKHVLKENDNADEKNKVIRAFMSTLVPPKFQKKVKVVEVCRIQNLAMWQSYVVKRQSICYRETGQGGSDDPAIQRRALERFERSWLWHGTNVEVMDKILQQGFNRSFCGKNATMYGKGVYFARDASYSAYPLYSVPDKRGYQYVMACRVVVGEYCPGVKDALTPEIRDKTTNSLYDTTVGLLTDDTMANPSIYVTYHDAQAYPEYLIKFKAT